MEKEFKVEWTYYNCQTTEYGLKNGYDEIAYGENPEDAIEAVKDMLFDGAEVEEAYRENGNLHFRTYDGEEYEYINFTAKEVER